MITYPLNNILYQAEDAELFHSTRGSGIYAGSDFAYSVSGLDNNITIGEGIGWIKNSKFSGKVIASKSPIVLTLETADTIYSRIDAIVIQFDANANNTEIIIKKGIASTNPIAPEIIQTETLFELHLYHILREPNSSAITSSSITDLRLNPQYCGLMADSVTQVDTNAIWAQITELIQNYRSSINEIIEEELQEAKDSGEFDGATFIPSISNEGVLSWTNNGGLENPATVNIRGQKGDTGATGADGAKGDKGDDGYTPVRGTDYWTAADIAEIKSYVDSAILMGAW